jgi:hypothetical protein
VSKRVFWLILKLPHAQHSIRQEGMDCAKGMHSPPEVSAMVNEGVGPTSGWFNVIIVICMKNLRLLPGAKIQGTRSLAASSI